MSDVSRRAFLAAGAAAGGLTWAADPPAPRQASGVKVGEVTDSAAVVWTRLTAAPSRNATGRRVVGRPAKGTAPADLPLAELQGACPGAAGRIRVRFGNKPDLADAQATDWVAVTDRTDFTHQFRLSGLPADADVFYAVETTGPDGTPHGPLSGMFRTAPRPDADAEVTFAAVTCQMYADLDHPDGFHLYPAIQKLNPRFVAFTGDNVYYDSELPVATSPALARYHWERMYSLPRHAELLRGTATYWEKDDHDTVANDGWPGRRAGDLTWAAGQEVFRRQVPMGETIYRTFRWGKHLQIWLTDGRDFRSPNTAPDGPGKTIWGAEQKAWLFRTLNESDATWKVLISPTPVVGPDRGNKGDNHANAAFRHEGDEVRAWFKANVPGNLFVVCGDRHWQYHSAHPATGLNEFSIGAASDAHAGGSPGEDKAYHKFHRVKGGFLSVTAGGRALTARHHDVTGAVVYQYETTRS